jgi:hypothetical protein
LCATCFGLYLSHPQACQYKKLTKEGKYEFKGPVFTAAIIIILKYIYTILYLSCFYILFYCILLKCRSQWPPSLRRKSAAARLLRSWVRIPTGAWMFVCFECCVLSGRGLCHELITRPEESYRLWCVIVCDTENLKNEETMTRVGSQRQRKNMY